MIKVRNFFLNLNGGSISRLENIKNCNIMELKYKIGEWVFHRFGDEIKHGKIVGYDDDCYIIKTLVDDIFGYMHLKDEDVSKNYEELKN
jgi:hypothetical protein